MSTFGKARFFEEFTAPGKVRCWTSAWRRTQEQVAAEVPFSRWIGEEFEVSTSTSGDLFVAAVGQSPRRVASPLKFAPVSAPKVIIDEVCGAEPSPKVDNRTATGMSILQNTAAKHENKVRNEHALSTLANIAALLALKGLPAFYVDVSDPTPKFDHTALKAEWSDIRASEHPEWWAIESKDVGEWRAKLNPFFHDDKEYRIVKSEHHPDVVREKVKAEYDALCKSGEIKHWDVEWKGHMVDTSWITTPYPEWRKGIEYRLVKRNTHPDVVRDKVRAEWTARELAIASGKPVRKAYLEFRIVKDTEWHRCDTPQWFSYCEYRIVYPPTKTLIDMSAMPAGTNTTVGKIVGHHLFQKPGSVFVLAEGANRIQEWKAEDVDLVEKQEWINWEATATSECPIPKGVKYIAKFNGTPENYEATPVFPHLQWKLHAAAVTIIAFKILGTDDKHTFDAKEAA